MSSHLHPGQFIRAGALDLLALFTRAISI